MIMTENLAEKLMEEVGNDRSRLYELFEMYHAVEPGDATYKTLSCYTFRSSSLFSSVFSGAVIRFTDKQHETLFNLKYSEYL